MGREMKVEETASKIFDFCQAIFAPPSKWPPWHMPCLPYPIYATVIPTEPSPGGLQLGDFTFVQGD